ncbi:TlpA family protein disulfide reductase [bacterium]|nr:TlpA family protein disulfide reductase [bacterium]
MAASCVLAQDRSGAVKQLRSLSAAPGSVQPTVLPPDGRPWIVFIFKACCAPADQAARWIVNTQVVYGDRVGVLVINVDRGRSLQRVNNWIRSHNIKFPVVSDPTAQVAQSWGVIAPPTVVILDSTCREVYRTIGYQSSYGTRLRLEISHLLQDSTTTYE